MKKQGSPERVSCDSYRRLIRTGNARTAQIRYRPHQVGKHVLMVLLLTMQRRGELARAECTEFDFDNRRWKIPASHNKSKREHAAPLTRWAIAELKALKLLANTSRFVLPGNNRHARRAENREGAFAADLANAVTGGRPYLTCSMMCLRASGTGMRLSALTFAPPVLPSGTQILENNAAAMMRPS